MEHLKSVIIVLKVTPMWVLDNFYIDNLEDAEKTNKDYCTYLMEAVVLLFCGPWGGAVW